MYKFSEKLAGCTGFDWWERHGVSATASEQIFFQSPILVAPDREHSQDEERHTALGKTAADTQLTTVFTMRGTLIRVISTRDMSRRKRMV